MDRFFSKLDLRDIKIDPRGTRFPPDEAAYADDVKPGDAPVSDATRADEPHGFVTPQELPYQNGTDTTATVAPELSPLADGAPATDWATPVASTLNGLHETGAGMLTDGDDVCSDVLKVSARSRPSAVAGAIAGVVREAGRAEVQAIGAGATNQAIKAVAIARDYLKETGIEAVCLPAFIDITIDNEDRTAIRLVIEPR